MAVGVSVEEKNLLAFREGMQKAVDSQLAGGELISRLELDAEISLADMDGSFFDHYEAMEPFGMGNHEPIFLIRNVEPALPGQIIRDKHWKLLLKQGREVRPAMWFSAPWREAPAAPWDVAVRLQRHYWRGTESWQLMVCGARKAQR